MMMEWKQGRYPVDTRVKVLFKDEIYNGVLMTDYELGSMNNEMPSILLENGETVEGCACWWIPLNELGENDI